MNVSEYAFVFISFILALAVGELVKGLGRILRPQSNFKADGQFLLWIVLLFLSMLQFWWGNWQWNQIERWSILTLLFPTLGAVMFYLAADITFSVDPDELDGSAYQAIASRVWSILAVYFAIAWLAWRAAGLRDFSLDARGVVQIFIVGFALLLAVSGKRWLHWIGLVFFTCLILANFINSTHIS